MWKTKIKYLLYIGIYYIKIRINYIHITSKKEIMLKKNTKENNNI